MQNDIRVISLVAFFATLCCFAPSRAHAGGPENVLVVVNQNSPESLAVANHFIHLRNIPASNVVYLESVPDPAAITCSLRLFKENILSPVVEAISERKLDNQIDYIVYSAGFPTGIEIKAHVDILKSRVQNVQNSMVLPRASINSLTYFFQDVMRDDPSYLSMSSNWYARRLVKTVLSVPFGGAIQKSHTEAIADYNSGEFEKAAAKFSALVKDHPQQIAVRYYLARALGKQKKRAETLQQLELCVQTGWCHQSVMESDEAFAFLAAEERFKEIVASSDKLFFGILPTRSFSSKAMWAPNGWMNGNQKMGKRFVLSTVLAATHGRGNTLDQAIEQLQRSAAADYSQPTGTFYFSTTADIRSKARQRQFPIAVRELTGMGFGAELITGVLPSRKKDVLGVTLGFADPKWQSSRSSLVPGALVDNLTSFGGIMDVTSKQTPCTHFLEFGATGVSGTVTEPLAIPNKFPDARLHVHYARGCTLAESYYQSVLSPFQLLIIGDPLCKPWANKIEFTMEGISEGDSLENDFMLTLKGTDEADSIQLFQLFVDGKLVANVAPDRPTKIQLSDLPDGYHELRAVAIAKSLIATRTSQQLGFTLDRNGHSVSLDISGNGKYQLRRTLPVTVESNVGDAIHIYQNLRKIASVDGRSGSLSLDCEDLGQGPTTLRAVVMVGETPVTSQPVEIEINP